MSSDEDFGGADLPPSNAQKMREWRARQEAAGLCRFCSTPVKIKRNGQPAKVCQRHADLDTARKNPPR